MTWQFVLTGFLIGTLVGLTGMGGGSLMTRPRHPFRLQADARDRDGHRPRCALQDGRRSPPPSARQRAGQLSGWMFLGSAPTSLLGVAVGVWLTNHYGDSVDAVTGRILGTALVLGALGLFAKGLLRPKASVSGSVPMTNRNRIAAVLIGLFGGFIVGLTSVGSGTLFGLTMLILFPLGAQKMVGTDILHAAALLYVAGAGHMLAGNVDLTVVGWLLLGSIPGILLGSQWSIRLPDRVLRQALATVLLLPASSSSRPRRPRRESRLRSASASRPCSSMAL